MRARRGREQFEFQPPATAAVLDRMRVLSEAADGWINLLPGVPEEEAAQPKPGIFSAIFGSAQPPVTMCTWIPQRPGRGRASLQSVGILHPRGRRAATQLGELGVPVPAGWKIGQDHPRRGLILYPAPDADAALILDWTLRAGTVLAALPLTGTWQARVFLPLDAPRNSGGPWGR